MIWQSLHRPFFVLAPLEGVTDTVFRQIVASLAKPHVFFTEFTSAEGLCSPGQEKVAENFRSTPIEQPLVAQIWGKNPRAMYESAKMVADMNFAGIDINMGCPDRVVVGHGCGAGMIDTPEVARSVIAAVKSGVRDAGSDMPISVKTRLGNKKQKTREWISFLLGQELDALTIHGRTAAEMSKVPARWEEIAKGVEIRDQMKVKTVIIGNGDAIDAIDAKEKHTQYGVDGVMIGRGIFQNLWAFDASPKRHEPSELLVIMERHIRLFDETWADRKNYATLKKFYKIYVQGFYGATEWRVKFMDTQSIGEALLLLDQLRKTMS